MKKPLFDEEYETYNSDANHIDRELTKVLKPIIRKYCKEYSMNDLELVFINCVSISFCEVRIVENTKIKKEKRERTNS